MAYKEKVGHYPLQDALKNDKEIITVNILTQFQREHNKNSTPKAFTQKSMKQFVKTLSVGLNKEIDEHYDMQKIATNSPVGYHYFATKQGYAFWVTCITCGVTPISTLLMDGHTPTVNIASEGMLAQITKSKTRQEMLSHPIYKKWLKRPFHKKGYADSVLKTYLHDSQD